MDKNDNLVGFMIEQLGGEKAVKQEYCRKQISKITETGGTVGELLVSAEQEGWLDYLRDLKLSSLATPQKRSFRLTKVDKSVLQTAILKFVKANPWCYGKDLILALNVHGPRLGTQLKSLRNAKKLKTVGERSAMRYALEEHKDKVEPLRAVK